MRPPFRNPHSSSSLMSLLGGGPTPKPGEISLAHNGILYLDELPEFCNLDQLRAPLEEGIIHIARSRYTATFPARFLLIASMNPCKCGLLTIEGCRCANNNYLQRISKPILDRIDMYVTLLKKSINEQTDYNNKELGDAILYAHKQQKARGDFNGFIDIHIIEPDKSISEYVDSVMVKRNLSMRKREKIIRVARTIADLDKSPEITMNHIHEALIYVVPTGC